MKLWTEEVYTETKISLIPASAFPFHSLSSFLPCSPDCSEHTNPCQPPTDRTVCCVTTASLFLQTHKHILYINIFFYSYMNKRIVVNEIPTNYLIIDKTNNDHIIIIMANILFKNFKLKYLRGKSFLYLKGKL